MFRSSLLSARGPRAGSRSFAHRVKSARCPSDKLGGFGFPGLAQTSYGLSPRSYDTEFGSSFPPAPGGFSTSAIFPSSQLGRGFDHFNDSSCSFADRPPPTSRFRQRHRCRYNDGLPLPAGADAASDCGSDVEHEASKRHRKDLSMMKSITREIREIQAKLLQFKAAQEMEDKKKSGKRGHGDAEGETTRRRQQKIVRVGPNSPRFLNNVYTVSAFYEAASVVWVLHGASQNFQKKSRTVCISSPPLSCKSEGIDKIEFDIYPRGLPGACRDSSSIVVRCSPTVELTFQLVVGRLKTTPRTFKFRGVAGFRSDFPNVLDEVNATDDTLVLGLDIIEVAKRVDYVS
eukprot:GHVU01172795.1.p1 GENE.GHVU01172795.1~~GHVU01172795.1.p1  ORF type:complete len:345 (+),score=36.69 GHVU01172795.1:277-1311(+)